MDMSAEETTLMHQHMAYFSGLVKEGACIIYGPVMEAKSVWGLAILEAEDMDTARAMAEKDPSITGGLNTYELHPMQVGMMRAEQDI